MGHKVFEPLVPLIEMAKVDDADSSSENLYIKTSKGISATGIVSPDGFIVLKDSGINEAISEKSLSENIIKLRNQYLSNGTVINGVFTKNTLFSSPSAAADFIYGYSSSGPASWKNSSGKTLKQINKEQSTI